ncbi:hypothetical protein ACFP1Z_27990 [Streptomyces gamaensis]|uniref:Pentapeptide repeat-containing protein n=1 Tax=Streptomyces gamaensis TaxID=1763542 RepID=A0ABW0ZA88_9ACTN
MADLYGLNLDGARFAKACGDSKRPDMEPLRFTTAELDAAGIDPGRFNLTA